MCTVVIIEYRYGEKVNEVSRASQVVVKTGGKVKKRRKRAPLNYRGDQKTSNRKGLQRDGVHSAMAKGGPSSFVMLF